MITLENKIPPPAVGLSFGVAMWLTSDALWQLDFNTIVKGGAIVFLLLTGAIFCLMGVIGFRRSKTTVNPLKPETATALVSGGIYQLSRNPMYVGFVCWLIAWAIYLSTPLSLIGVIGYILYLNYFQIIPEEKALLSLFGDDYRQYQHQVRRWL